MNRTVGREEFRAMGCVVEVELVGDDASVVVGCSTARRMIAEFERCWSRFLPNSDISRLNAAQGAMVSVHPATIDLLQSMVDGVAATDGCFDPTLLAPLVALGYDASWSNPQAITSLPAGSAWRGDVGSIAVDRAASVAQLPTGTVLDAGGIGKGLAADLVVAQLLTEGIDGAMVSIGGDLRVNGVGPSSGSWLIGVADAFDHTREITQLSLANAGVATSGTRRRAWSDSDGNWVHHLLDPSTALPTARELVQATVVAGTAAWAEVYTKMLMVRGVTGLQILAGLGLGARVVFGDGSCEGNAVWQTMESDKR
ncbi:MAG: FAD:protein FMN transferase [Actinobacteria bacterium]|nr:FAD:protein FMN transferase [Actinomycetota bacterium]